jgi:hypothetical protein
MLFVFVVLYAVVTWLLIQLMRRVHPNVNTVAP